MKLKTAFLKIFILLVFFLFVPKVFAQYYEVEQDTVVVQANITVDFFSTVNLFPPTVEIFQPSNVEVRVLSSNGIGIPGRQIVLVAPGLTITQPSTLTSATGRTNGSVSTGIAGSYSVCAKDVTFGYDITIQNCKTLYVIPVPIPTLLPEPQYTKGLSNLILWESLGASYTYDVQVSEFADFSVIKEDSGYTPNTSYEFQNLENGKMYFYRVRAKNQYGGVSAWSNIVYSVQDAQPPVVEFLDISDIGENNTVEWVGSDIVTLRFRVTDNLELDSEVFSCLNSKNSLYTCTSNYSIEGDILTVVVRLGDLERVSGIYLRESYKFCVDASDKAGNVTRFCDATLNVPKGVQQEETAPPPVIDRIEKGLEDLDSALDETIGQLDPGDLQRVTTATTVATTTSIVAIAAGGLGAIPYFLFELLLNLLTFFGFRRGSKPVGFVYDSVTKEPVIQAIVRVFNEEKRIVWSDVTDSKGYFRAKLKAGKYTIVVRAPGYTFPSNIVFGKEDYPLTNVYHSEVFEVVDGTDINFAIPMDPTEVSKFRLAMESFWGRVKFVVNILQVLLFLIGLTFAFYMYYNNPYWLTLLVLLLFVPTYILLMRNIFLNKDRYGIVKDKEGKLLEGVVVGLREAEFDKIITKRVTDSRGRYRFFVGEGRYYIEILDTVYKVESIEKGNEILAKKETLIDRDIILSKIEA